MRPPPPVLPLTHHEILEVVEPFSRRGRRVDLAASDRSARRIVFRAVDHAASPDGLPALRESLGLEDVGDGRWRLTRRLDLADGLQASLQTEGRDPGALLARIDAVAASRQIRAGDGWTLAMTHRLGPRAASPSAIADAAATRVGDDELVLVRGTVHVHGLALTMKVPTVSGISADLSIEPLSPGDPIVLPEDLLAVLGRGWPCLARGANGWNAPVGLRGRGAARIADAQARLVQAAGHLASTLAEPPRAFHERRRAARWRVTLRRTVPLLASLALVAGAAGFPALELADDSPIRLLVFSSPPLLLALFFCLREMPRIEIPPLPRPSTASAWREPHDTEPAPR